MINLETFEKLVLVLVVLVLKFIMIVVKSTILIKLVRNYFLKTLKMIDTLKFEILFLVNLIMMVKVTIQNLLDKTLIRVQD